MATNIKSNQSSSFWSIVLQCAELLRRNCAILMEKVQPESQYHPAMVAYHLLLDFGKFADNN